MMIEYFRMAFRNMMRHGLRTILTMIGIVVGTCAVIAIYSVGSGGREQILESFESLGFSGVVVTAPSGYAFQSRDISDLERGVDEVKSVMPLIYQSVNIGLDGTDIATTALGVGNNAIALSVAGAAYGRGFSISEIHAASKVCMIDCEIANQLYHRENVVGREILLNIGGREEKFRIIGVVSKEDTLIGGLLGESAQFIYVPYTTCFEMTGNSGFEAFLMSVDNINNADLTAKKVIHLLEIQSNRSGFYYENLSKQEDTLSTVIHTITIIISAIAAISLIVGGVGVMTVMLVAVNERKQEIGIKKAIGATNKDIMTEFVAEAVALSMFGGLIGTILGYLLSLVAKPILGIQSNFDINISICALLFCAGIGIIFSVYPARKASRLNPIDCLKCE